MTPGNFPLNVYRGATFGPVVLTAYSDVAHTLPVNLTGWLPHAKVKVSDVGPIILDLLPVISNGVGGVITIPALTSLVTDNLPRGNYVWDLLLERPTGEVLGPFLSGSFTIQTAVSRAT